MHPADRTTTSSRRIADRLRAVQRSRFVGRSDEIALFERVILSDEPPLSVLHVYGPGGIGKTTLLKQFQQLASESGVQTVWLDAREMEASPPGFHLCLSAAIGLTDTDAVLEHLDDNQRRVIFLDTYELLSPLDDWLRESFIPQRSSENVFVIAGRNLPTGGWRSEPGWSDFVRFMPLRNLEPEESRRYLSNRGVVDDVHRHVLDYTYGHPLALSLVADILIQGESLPSIDPLEHPDLVGLLVERFVRQLPGESHRQAIEVCAHARITTEALLSSTFGNSMGRELFDWLRGLSFIEQSAEGIFPHDLAREVIELDVRWRDPDAYRQLHARVRKHVVRRLRESEGTEQQRAFFDLLFLHRNNPFMRPHYDWESLGKLYAEPASPADFRVIRDLIRAHHGEDSATIAEHWWARRPDSFSVFRGSGEAFSGFGCQLVIGDVTEEDLHTDSVLASLWRYVEQRAPIRPGEEILITRFFMDNQGDMNSGDVSNMGATMFVTKVLTNPKLAWSFILTSEPEIWHASYVYLNQFPTPEAELSMDGRRFFAYSHDWRTEPALDWLETMESREITNDLKLETLEAGRPPQVVVLSKPEFYDAVRNALRDLARADRLAKNPLIRSRLVLESNYDGEPVSALRTLILKAAESLNCNPRDRKFYRAVWRTYLEPADSQELAAEALNVPFSTYRYHLAGGIERICDWLWDRELEPQS